MLCRTSIEKLSTPVAVERELSEYGYHKRVDLLQEG